VLARRRRRHPVSMLLRHASRWSRRRRRQLHTRRTWRGHIRRWRRRHITLPNPLRARRWIRTLLRRHPASSARRRRRASPEIVLMLGRLLLLHHLRRIGLRPRPRQGRVLRRARDGRVRRVGASLRPQEIVGGIVIGHVIQYYA